MDDRDSTSKMESGQKTDLKDAMNDVATTVEYLLDEN